MVCTARGQKTDEKTGSKGPHRPHMLKLTALRVLTLPEVSVPIVDPYDAAFLNRGPPNDGIHRGHQLTRQVEKIMHYLFVEGGKNHKDNMAVSEM